MVKADYASDLPGAAFVLPERDELGFSYFVVVSGVMEAVRTDLYCAIASEGIDLQCSRYELSGDFAADVVLMLSMNSWRPRATPVLS
jgi:hypothetical protein